MRRYGKQSGLILIIGILLFNATAFLIPHQNTTTFWWSYSFALLAFVLQIVFAHLAFGKDITTKKAYFGLPVAKYSLVYLHLQIIWSFICIFTPISTTLTIIINLLILGLSIILVVRSLAAINIVTSLDTKIKIKTFYIKSMIVDIEILLAGVEGQEEIEEIKTLLETVKYSDPMSNEALANVEGRISDKYNELTQAVEKQDIAQIKLFCKQLNVLLVERNKKCQFLK